MWVWKIAGVVILWVGVTKHVIFRIFHRDRDHGTEKNLEGQYPLPRALSPLKIFWRCKLGLARCIHSHFATVGLGRFSLYFGF